jgi:hypothetical protein
MLSILALALIIAYFTYQSKWKNDIKLEIYTILSLHSRRTDVNFLNEDSCAVVKMDTLPLDREIDDLFLKRISDSWKYNGTDYRSSASKVFRKSLFVKGTKAKPIVYLTYSEDKVFAAKLNSILSKYDFPYEVKLYIPKDKTTNKIEMIALRTVNVDEAALKDPLTLAIEALHQPVTETIEQPTYAIK